jgi:hypothetical protein
MLAISPPSTAISQLLKIQVDRPFHKNSAVNGDWQRHFIACKKLVFYLLSRHSKQVPYAVQTLWLRWMDGWTDRHLVKVSTLILIENRDLHGISFHLHNVTFIMQNSDDGKKLAGTLKPPT